VNVKVNGDYGGGQRAPTGSGGGCVTSHPAPATRMRFLTGLGEGRIVCR